MCNSTDKFPCLGDSGIRNEYIKLGTPGLNGKVVRSHGKDKDEIYQMMKYKNDLDLNKKPQE
jgi:hypothetical protein